MDKFSNYMEYVLVVLRVPIFILFLAGGVIYVKKKYKQFENKLYFWLIVLLILMIIALPFFIEYITTDI